MRISLSPRKIVGRWSRRSVVLFGVGVAGLLLIGVGIVMTWPKTVALSYAEQTCTSELTLLPGIQRLRDDSDYEIEYQNVRTVGSVEMFASDVCFRPVTMPEPGEKRLATSLWGSVLTSQAYTLLVGQEPKLSVSALERPLPATKPVTIELDQPDGLNDYTLAVGDKSTTCVDEAQNLICDLDSLALKQGKKYDYRISKQFVDGPSKDVAGGELTTLRAVTVKKTSVKKGQTIYAKPRSFTFELDKPITSADVELRTGDKTHEITAIADGKIVKVTTKKDLDREKKYELVLKSVDAVDGSTLVDAYRVPFTMSGGPKVVSVSVGSSRVDPSARIIVTFDQALSDQQNIASLMALKGGPATISKLNPTQVAVQLGGLGRCVPFTISLSGGALSKYDIKSDAPWSYRSRTICYTTSVYGTSVQGRPLVAYYFGSSGPITLYTGAIHGNEVSSKYMMDSWIADLEANAGQIGNRRIVVIPSINPDGVAAGTRNNARNVNLSRNFPTDNWVRDINDTNGPLKDGGGTKPLSEPEVAALSSLVQRLRPRLLVSYHAVGSLVVGDPGGFSATKASRYAGLVGYRDATGAGGTFDYDITGSFEEWTYHNAGIPSMVVELGSYSYHNFAHHRTAMWAMLD